MLSWSMPRHSALRLSVLFSCALAFTSASASAHVILRTPVPRDSGDGYTNGPCGSTMPGQGMRTALTAGSQVMVTWDKTVDHSPQTFRLVLSPDGLTGFDDPNNVIVKDIPGPAGMQSYSYQWTVPSTPCETCTLQLVQASAAPYYSCADIAILAGGTDGGVADAGPGDAGSSDTGGVDAAVPVDRATGTDSVAATDVPVASDGGARDVVASQADVPATTDRSAGRDASTSGSGGGCTVAGEPNAAGRSAAAPWLLGLGLIALFARRRRSRA
jgi:MYXO-CTERM domain-containing protein